jgi:hypothetical protein
MNHLPANALQFGLAGEQDSSSGRELLPQIRLIEPQPAQIGCSAADQHSQERTPGASVAQINLFNHAHHAGELVFFELVNLPQFAHILIGTGKVKQNITGVMQLQLRQKFPPLRPNTFEELHRRGEFLGGRFFGRLGHNGILRKR